MALEKYRCTTCTTWASVFTLFVQSVKTYTRRGRGRCLNPECSFMYVTRHKPPKCPECGHHLGGKWIPVVSKKEPTHTKTIGTICQNSVSMLVYGRCHSERLYCHLANSSFLSCL